MKLFAAVVCLCLLISPVFASDDVKTADTIRIIYFTGRQCPACEANKPVFLKFQNMLKDILKIEEGDRKLAKKYNVEYIPTLIILKGEKMVLKKTGIADISEYVNAAKKAGISFDD